MGFVTVFLIAIGLSMDAFAVSISNGVAIKRVRYIDCARVGIFFGVFQLLMPVLGWYLGSSVRQYIEAFDHWVAFILLFAIGLNMIKESLSKEEECQKEFVLSNKKLVVQAIATSIDALAVGISFAVLDVDVLSASMVIGVVCFFASFIGMGLGKKLGEVFKGKAELLGGMILICIGAKILLEHVFF